MKKIKSLFLIIILVLCASVCTYADDEPLFLSITSDHKRYEVNENINIKIELENHGAYPLKDLDLTISASEDLKLINGSLIANDLNLESLGKYDQTLDFVKEKPQTTPNPSNKDVGQQNQSNQNTNTPQSNQPTNMEDVKTSDSSQLGLWIILLDGSLLVMIAMIALGYKKQAVCLMLCTALASSTLPLTLYASEEKAKVVLEHPFMVNGEQKTIKVTVTYREEKPQTTTPATSSPTSQDQSNQNGINRNNETMHDADLDGLTDEDEMVLGLDPNNPKTDGITLDSERYIPQVLSEVCIDESLLNQPIVKPSLQVTTKGNINRSYRMVESGCNDFSDSRAIVSLPIDIVGNDFSEAILSFQFKEHISNVDSFIICKYDEEGTTYLDTTYDETTQTLSANINSKGTYFILNAFNLLNELGLGSSNLTRKTSQAMAQADIVFVIDSTASMKEEINNVRSNVDTFVTNLKNQGISPALALVSYQDITYDGEDTTVVYQNNNENWFYDLDAYKQVVANIELGHGGDKAESTIDALETARELDMRPSAGKIFILVTDAGYKVENRYNIPSMEAMIHLLNNEGVNTSVITSSKYQSTYQNLYEQTKGFYYDIKSNFATSLTSLVSNLSNDIVGDGYWIYLDGPVPLPVRLDAKPSANSSVDTDGDGVRDIDELTSITPTRTVDLDELITTVSKGAITNTNYGVVETYTYNSNPIVADTDYDGVIDLDDNMPKVNVNKGVAYFSFDDESNAYGVEFTMDYRTLIEHDNTVYSKELAILSSLYSEEVYTDNYIQITEGAQTGGNDTGVELGNMLGLQDTQMISINASDYEVDKDDLSAFFVGHRKIRYNNEKHEVIVVAVRGTNGTNTEWSSNFDVGADTSEYYQALGTSHPHWRNKDNHKGFDVSSNRILDKLEAYIEEYVDDSANLNILITGHSRGAAIANILGAHYENDQRYNSYTYTFATPNVTEAANASSYQTIFNVVNYDDIITYLPLESWGFTKYGVTRALSVEEYYENEWGSAEEGTWEWLMNGTDYNDDSLTESTVSNIAAIATCREDLYVLETADIGKVWEDDLGHVSLSGAQEEVEELNQVLTQEKLRKFCNVYTTKWGLLYYAEINYCPAYLLQTIANMATGVGPTLGRDVAGKYATAKTAFVASSGKVVIGGMTHPHIPGTYYLMVRNDLKPLE